MSTHNDIFPNSKYAYNVLWGPSIHWKKWILTTFMEVSIQEAKYVLSNVVLCLHQPTSSAEIDCFLLTKGAEKLYFLLFSPDCFATTSA